jgi:tRNA(Ile)-lysidine synthase
MVYFDINKNIRKNGLADPQDHILLGISGGSDSIAMLHLFVNLPKDKKPLLGVAHLNHGIRGKLADRDEKLVNICAEKYGLRFYTRKVDVPALAKRHKLSIEDAARIARYEYFRKLCSEHGFNKIALAHTLDDNTETILMKLLRGTGLKGLCGIPETRPIFATQTRLPAEAAPSEGGRTRNSLTRQLSNKVTIIRPLLSCSKSQLRSYCKQHRLLWHEDHTNKQADHLRNKIRNNIIPALRKINPNLDVTLSAMGTVLKEEDRYLDELAADHLKPLTQKRTASGIRLDTKTLLTLPLALQRRMLRLAMEQVQGSLQDVYLPFIENFLENKLTTITLDEQGHLRVSKERL